MKLKNLILTSLIAFAAFGNLIGQYSTPGTGISWSMELLAENAGDAISVMNDIFYVNQDITISTTDTIMDSGNQTILFQGGILFTVEGVLKLNPVDSTFISPVDTTETFLGFRFENSDASLLRKCHIRFAGGLKLVNASITIDSCTLEKFDKSNCTGTIDLFQSSPQILNCNILNNMGPAVLSAANGLSAPYIEGNFFYRNNTENTNMPQLNLGNTNTEDQLKILNNTIEGFYNKAGGIAVTTLAGGTLNCLIDGNNIFNNRYGITVYGFDITSDISNNIIADNNIENIPMQGGSGINYWGNNTNVSVVHHNQITGNLWGITNTGNALPNLGQVDPDTINPGSNLIFDNGNLGNVYAFYNNTPEDIFAENNYWGSFDPDSAEAVIFHYPDDESLGFVDYLPIKGYITSVEQNNQAVERSNQKSSLRFYPNPVIDFVSIECPDRLNAQTWQLLVFNMEGKKLMDNSYRTGEQINISNLKTGHYLVYLTNEEATLTGKFSKK